MRRPLAVMPGANWLPRLLSTPSISSPPCSGMASSVMSGRCTLASVASSAKPVLRTAFTACVKASQTLADTAASAIFKPLGVATGCAASAAMRCTPGMVRAGRQNSRNRCAPVEYRLFLRSHLRSAAQPSRAASLGTPASQAANKSGSTTLAMKLWLSKSCCCTACAVTLPRASSSGISVRPARVRGRSTRASPTKGPMPSKRCCGWVKR